MAGKKRRENINFIIDDLFWISRVNSSRKYARCAWVQLNVEDAMQICAVSRFSVRFKYVNAETIDERVKHVFWKYWIRYLRIKPLNYVYNRTQSHCVFLLICLFVCNVQMQFPNMNHVNCTAHIGLSNAHNNCVCTQIQEIRMPLSGAQQMHDELFTLKRTCITIYCGIGWCVYWDTFDSCFQWFKMYAKSAIKKISHRFFPFFFTSHLYLNHIWREKKWNGKQFQQHSITVSVSINSWRHSLLPYQACPIVVASAFSHFQYCIWDFIVELSNEIKRKE